MEFASILIVFAAYLLAALADAPKFRDVSDKAKNRAVYYVLLAAGFLLSAGEVIAFSRR